MAYPMIYAALFLAVSMAFINDAEGQDKNGCNDAEVDICKKAAESHQTYYRCQKDDPCSCKVTCCYKTPNGTESKAEDSPNGQECKMNNKKGICKGGACYN